MAGDENVTDVSTTPLFTFSSPPAA